MPCYNPLVAFRAKQPNAQTGKHPMVFSAREALDADDPVKLPCGQCIGCRLERSRQWAIRCVHEASLYDRNCFITLTFAPEHLPKSGSLDKRDFQLFMKRLRKRFGPGARYFHCGEYGERNGRPHYHACLFNFDFDDKYVWRKTAQGHTIWRSPSLDGLVPFESWGGKPSDSPGLWPFGMCEIGEVNFETAAYVARYVTKKVTGEMAESHYERVDPRTGEITSLLPEYTTMSRRPGIGRGWLEKYTGDVYPHDRVILRGMPMHPPKYYDSIFELANPEMFDDVKESRKRKMMALAKDGTFDRLRVRERHQYIRFDKLKRGYENG